MNEPFTQIGAASAGKSLAVFAVALKRWRTAHTLTQTQAAAHIGVPVDRYRSWEQGRYEPEALVRELVASKMSAKANG